MALNIIGAGVWASAQRGIAFNETGIAIRRWSVRFNPEINEKLANNLGETIARAVSSKASREITVEGEVTGTTGVMAIAFGAAITAYTFFNDAQWGTIAAQGYLILDEVTETQERAGWRSINMRISSNPELHA